MEHLKENDRGVLFINDKQKTDRHPTHVGRIRINDVDYWLSAWEGESEAGNWFMSLAIGDEVDYSKSKAASTTKGKGTRSRTRK